ncbi:MAG TPA: DUF4256 domain-containing protein [Saprospirales bacterium]|nr:DUF4256 domain-containing protein [Saprospirales bacterium]HRQ29364.1 DUF4256 domain-containing protein [Saprospiraceae bacterium]
MNVQQRKLSTDQQIELFQTLKTRFQKNMHRHPDLSWDIIQEKLEKNPGKIWSVYQMEITGGEPDVMGVDPSTDEYIFVDCSSESPKGRRSLCYDGKALNDRKEFKPENSVLDMASEMGIDLLDEAKYRELQQLGKFDTKTSSWIVTPGEIRKLGGALFMEYRYGAVFVFHNGASSYYAARGFRGSIRI